MDKMFKFIEKVFANKKVYWTIFIFGVLALSAFQYLGLIIHHYPVPPGHDAMMHWNMAQPFYQGNVNLLDYLKSGAYPPGFLIFIAKMAHLFNTDMMEIIKWFAPSIIVLAAVSMFYLVYYIFNPSAALICFYLYSFTAKIQIQQLNDGGYPNLIAAQILLPLFMLMLFLFIKNKKRINKIIFGLLTLILFISLPITHHLTTLYLLAVAAILPIIIIIYKMTTKVWSIKKGLLYFGGILILLVIGFYLFLTSELFASTRGLMEGSIQLFTTYPFFKIIGSQDPESILKLDAYPYYIGGVIVFYFGCLGIFALPFIKNLKNKLWLFPVAIWAFLLIAGSRLTFLSNPDRLVRDSVYPLSILAGLIIYFISIFLIKKNKIVGLIFTILVILAVGRSFINKAERSVAYEPMVRVTDADMQAINYLKTQAPGNVYVEAYTFYFERFLPNWKIGYLWLPDTFQPATIHPLDPSNPTELTTLRKYDYVYIVDNQIGWTPSAVKFHFAAQYLNNPNFVLEVHASSEINEVYLFKVKQ
jgi:hypothetical protein